MLAGALCACAPSLAPTADLSDDLMLATLPPGVTLVGGGDLTALSEVPLVSALVDQLDVDLEALAIDLEQTTGVHSGELAVQQVRLGCGDDGCVVLLEGDLRGFEGPRLGRLPLVRDRGPVQVVRTSGGERYALRVLSEDKAVLGDPAAVRRVVADQRSALQGAPIATFDPHLLDGAVPEGRVWLALRDGDRLVEQATERLARVDHPGAGQVVDQAREAWTRARQSAQGVEVVALALDLEDRATARLRLSCEDASTARAHAAVARLGLARLEVDDPDLDAALRQVDVVRVDRHVELTLVLEGHEVTRLAAERLGSPP